MKKSFTLLFTLFFLTALTAQTIIDFEDFGLSPGEFLNGSDENGGFESDGFFFPNDYNPAWMAWSGWAISATTDTQTPGFMNDLSAITGEGAGGSTTYATTFVLGQSVIYRNNFDIAFDKFQITNSTYAYLSMLEGDGFAKKFGGEDGTDPDFFLLTIKGWYDGQLIDDSIDFYLADYRFDDNSLDYIISDWQSIDLGGLNHSDSLIFTLSSSDNDVQFGMNTPAYFCIDNLEWQYILDAKEQEVDFKMSTFPNPTIDVLNIEWKEAVKAKASIYDVKGNSIRQFQISQGTQSIDVNSLPTGMYVLVVQTENGWTKKRY